MLPSESIANASFPLATKPRVAAVRAAGPSPPPAAAAAAPPLAPCALIWSATRLDIFWISSKCFCASALCDELSAHSPPSAESASVCTCFASTALAPSSFSPPTPCAPFHAALRHARAASARPARLARHARKSCARA